MEVGFADALILTGNFQCTDAICEVERSFPWRMQARRTEILVDHLYFHVTVGVLPFFIAKLLIMKTPVIADVAFARLDRYRSDRISPSPRVLISRLGLSTLCCQSSTIAIVQHPGVKEFLDSF